MGDIKSQFIYTLDRFKKSWTSLEI